MNQGNKDSIEENAKATLRRHPLAGLLFAQFIGAFNDNAWKLMVFTLATRALLVDGAGSAKFEYESQMKATLALLVFLIPMMLFSLPAGGFADRNSKRNVIIAMKVLEIGLMGAGVLTLFLAPLNIFIPYFLLGLLGIQSALFSPAKYGILPELLPYKKLSKGNGLLEMYTMLAIIAGTGLGPIMLAADRSGTKPWLSWTAPFMLMLFSIAGLAATFAIPKVEAARKQPVSIIRTIKEALAAIKNDRIILLAISGNVLLWLITSLLGQNVLVYAKVLVKELERGEIYQGIPAAAYGVGIALGAFIGGKLSRERIEYGLIPLGAIGFAVMSMALGLIQPLMLGTVAILIPMGMFSGMLVVPLKAIVQWRSPKEKRGAVISLGNVFDIFGMIVGSLAAAGMAYAGLNLGMTLIFSSFIVVAATIWSVKLLPEALTRLLFILLTMSFYKIRVKGTENIPKEGAALLVCNHLSSSDAFYIMTSIDRPVRFVMSESHYRKWWVKPFASIMKAIPVSYLGKAITLKEEMRKVGEHLKEGHLVCLFPEGQVSWTGFMQPFREGVEELIKGCSCPIIPVNLDRVLGTIFSPRRGSYIPNHPQHIPHLLTVSFGKPLPPKTSLSAIRHEIAELNHQAWMDRKQDEVPIHLHFIRSVWRAPWKHCLSDIDRKKISRIKVFVGVITLARLLKKSWEKQEIVGIMLPPTVAVVLTNVAATLTGRISVNVNFSLGTMDFNYVIKEANIQTIVTSRQFLKKIEFEAPTNVHFVFLEDLQSKATWRLKFSSALLGLFASAALFDKVCGTIKKPSMDDLLTIIYTSGSTGMPKGVMLSHFNVSSNVESISEIMPRTAYKDKFFHTLPFFHSFGYMSMWLGLNHPVPLVMHPNPLDAQAIARIVFEQKVTYLWTTPSFLKLYYSQIDPNMFGALNFVLTGAEKLPEKLCDAFHERFGIRPIQGYGVTECSPVIATNTLDVRFPGLYQAGSVRGSVGEPIPGVRVKIVDPDTFEELPQNMPGLLLVKGPNVMLGYLHDKKQTDEAFHNGWYITGDIGLIDENDYIKITDRLSRFSKIGGEMVPHGRIEEALHAASERTDEQLFLVTTVPNPNKGESLAVLHLLDEEKIPPLIKKLALQHLPKIYIPRLDHFIKVDALPVLGSGKFDLRKAKSIAKRYLRD